MKLQDLAARSHALAVEKGWYEGGERSTGELVALIHSEISEALEAYRSDGFDVWTECPVCGMRRYNRGHGGWACDRTGCPRSAAEFTTTRKPCGFMSELADIAIRAMDMAAYCGVAFDSAEIPCGLAVTATLFEVVNECHRSAGDLASLRWSQDHATYDVLLGHVADLALLAGGDLAAAIEEKHQYNTTRAHRHGGKRA